MQTLYYVYQSSTPGKYHCRTVEATPLLRRETLERDVDGTSATIKAETHTKAINLYKRRYGWRVS